MSASTSLDVFGKVINCRVKAEWRNHSLNYTELCNRLVRVKQEFGLRKAVSTHSLHGETRTFGEILDQEVEKIVLFYLQQQGEIAGRLKQLRSHEFQSLGGGPVTLAEIESSCQKYRDLGQVLNIIFYALVLIAFDSCLLCRRRCWICSSFLK